MSLKISGYFYNIIFIYIFIFLLLILLQITQYYYRNLLRVLDINLRESGLLAKYNYVWNEPRFPDKMITNIMQDI